MAGKVHVTSDSSPTSTDNATVRRKKQWIILGVIVGLVVIMVIVVPTTVVLTGKITTMNTTDGISSTIKEIITTTTELKTMKTETTSVAEITTMTTTKRPSDPCNRTYKTIANYTSGSSLSAMILDDVDGDNKSDIIVLDYFLRKVDVLFSNGNDTFTVQTISSVDDDSPFSVSTGDINNDGQIDIVVLHIIIRGIGQQRIIVFLNTGNRIFIEHRTYFIGGQPSFLIMADVNNDGYSDIIVGHNNMQRIGVHLNDGNGNFSDQDIFFHGTCPWYFVTLADLNNDSSLDIIVVCSARNEVSILSNICNGTFIVGKPISTDKMPNSAAILDVNKDQKFDLIITHFDSDKIDIYLNDGHGGFFKSITYSTGMKPEPDPIIVGDVSNDNEFDITFVNRASDNVGIFLNTGYGYSGPIIYSTDVKPFSVAVTDVNDDKQFDIIVAHKNSVGILYTNCP